METFGYLDHNGRFFIVDVENNVVEESNYSDFSKLAESSEDFLVKSIDIKNEASKIFLIQKTSDGNALAMSEKLAELSHEVNNPLAIVMSSLKVLEKVLGKETLKNLDLINENIDDIKSSIERVKSVMAHARTSVEAQKASFKNVSLKTLLNEVKSHFSMIFNELDITFETKIEDDLDKIEIEVIGTTISQCLFNLINNAYFELKKKSGEKHIKVLIKKSSSENVMISIVDNGAGIPTEIQDTIFDLNFTTKGSEGSGIGLYLVKKYTQLNKGNITLDKSFKGGAKFDLEFPLASMGVKKKTILMVDDEVEILEIVKSLINDHYTVLLATDANDAFRLLKSNSVDVVISDYKMPILTGYDFYKMVRGINKSIPFILFSGHISIELRDKFKLESNVKVLEKPHFEKLKAEIDALN